MVLRRAAKKPLMTTVISAILIISVIVVFSENRIQSETKNIENAKTNLNKAIASRTELRIHDAADILEIAARLPAIQQYPDPSLISTEYMGIAPVADPTRRQVLRSIYEEYSNFESVAFIMPNADVYAVEPASLQQNLPRINFADREYYKGVTSTNQTYISEVFRSTATNHNTIVIATPVFINATLGGIMVGALDLQAISDTLHDLELLKNELVIIVDKNGNQIASSNPATSSVNELPSFSHLEGFNNAISGESGISSERIDGILMNVAYSPIDIGNTKWALLLIQPYDDAYSQAISSQNESIIIIGLVLGIISSSGYLIFRALVENAQLNDRLEDANIGLKDLNKELQTEKKRLEYLSAELKVQSQKLKEVDKMKEEFSAMITHELKTPLVPIIGYSELLIDGTLGELTTKQKEKIQLIHESGVALSRLISDLLDVRKLELGQMKFEMSDTSPSEVVQHSVNTLTPMARAKNVSLVFDNNNIQLGVKCDPKRIQQVLHNLLTNAIKFVPENTGRIKVSVKPTDDDNSVLFAIKDNGIGIPKEKQHGLFKKFYQVDTSLSRNAGGTGLGLAISKGIIEAHNGKIWIESEHGAGATFYFTLPASKSELSATQEPRK